MYRRMIIRINDACNSRCRFCVYDRCRGSSRAHRSAAAVARAVARGKAQGIKEIIFTGGEPTLHPSLGALVSCARRRGMNIQLQTNGRLFAYPAYCEEMVRADIDCFCLALHGPSARIHDRLTRVPGSFRQTVLAIKNLKARRRTVVTNTVITKPNYRHLARIARLLVGLGVDKYQLIFPHITGEAHRNRAQMIVPMSEAVKNVRRALEEGRRRGTDVTVKAMPFCVLKGYAAHIRRSIHPDEKYVFFGNEKSDFAKNRFCKECVYDSLCEGPWREYPKIFGWKEFSPLRHVLPPAASTSAKNP
ncbi:MAG: radical SAM protein [Deltaproteobacteria bacterium]